MELKVVLGGFVQLKLDHSNIKRLLSKEDAEVILQMLNYMYGTCKCLESNCNGLKYKVQIIG